jgi:3-hydroxy-5-methyl-1-naphthoate 3-O-methyltransferase
MQAAIIATFDDILGPREAHIHGGFNMAKATKKKAAKKKATRKKQQLTPKRNLDFVWDFAKPLMIEAAIRNRLFDVLDEGPKSVEQLATATGASTRGLRILANGLVGIGCLERKGERLALPPDVGAFLVSTKPSFVGGLFNHCSSMLVPNWLQLSEIVRTGVPAKRANKQDPGGKFFADFVEDIFNLSFGPASATAKTLIGKAKRPVSVLDIAAGSGVWGVAFAKQSERVRVTAVDWPEVIPVTRRVADRHAVADRFTFIEGDILEADLGQEHTIATLGAILHSEGEHRSRLLLKRVFEALATGGTIVVGEFLPNKDRSGPPVPLIFGVNMLVNTEHGDTFTFDEMKAWLREAGYRKVRKLDVNGPWPLILADKP